jgi:2,5-diketo-D-gluconate reductase A
MSVSASKAVTTVTLANGVEMPLIAMGTWQYDSAKAKASCEIALQAGFDHFDTAHDYNNQDGVGQFFKEAVSAKGRDNLFLTSKVPGCGTQGVGAGKACAPDTQKVFKENLQLLQVDYVDLMLIHFPPTSCSVLVCKEIQEQWAVFEDMYAQNLTRAIGVSNYCQSCFECLFKTSKVKPMVNQLQFHVGMGDDPHGIKSYLDQHNIVMQSYSPLGDGSSELITGNFTNSIGKAYNKTGAQVALKWIAQKPVPVVTKASTMEHLAEDIDLFDWTITPADMQKLSEATTPKGNPSFMCSQL